MKLEIDTWGRCRRSYVEILYPEKINLTALTGRRGEHEIEVPGLCKIKYDNRDSSKNIHRDVEIVDVYVPSLIVRYWGALSCSRGFDEVYKVYKDGNEVRFEELEQREEIVETESGKFKLRVKRVYVEIDGKKITLSESEVGREVCVDKLTVKVLQKNGRTYVNGDTYHIREELKKLRYRWDPERKAWYKEASTEEVKGELESIGVQVVETHAG
jgi:glutamyl-tRNA reductase